MFSDFAKDYLHNDLVEVRASMLSKLDGLSEYDVRRPMTATGTNLLGMIKHLATWESRYLGEVFGRPFPGDVPRWDDPTHWSANHWTTEHERRSDIIDFYRQTSEHADETIRQLDIDASGHVPWWPRPDVMLFNVLVHRIAETNRHAGHADILREQLDSRGSGDPDASYLQHHDQAYWAERTAAIEAAAQAADNGTITD